MLRQTTIIIETIEQEHREAGTFAGCTTAVSKLKTATQKQPVFHASDLSELSRSLGVVSADMHHGEAHLQSPRVHDLFDGEAGGQRAVPVSLLRQKPPQVVLAGRLVLPETKMPE